MKTAVACPMGPVGSSGRDRLTGPGRKLQSDSSGLALLVVWCCGAMILTCGVGPCGECPGKGGKSSVSCMEGGGEAVEHFSLKSAGLTCFLGFSICGFVPPKPYLLLHHDQTCNDKGKGKYPSCAYGNLCPNGD